MEVSLTPITVKSVATRTTISTARSDSNLSKITRSDSNVSKSIPYSEFCGVAPNITWWSRNSIARQWFGDDFANRLFEWKKVLMPYALILQALGCVCAVVALFTSGQMADIIGLVGVLVGWPAPIFRFAFLHPKLVNEICSGSFESVYLIAMTLCHLFFILYMGRFTLRAIGITIFYVYQFPIFLLFDALGGSRKVSYGAWIASLVGAVGVHSVAIAGVTYGLFPDVRVSRLVIGELVTNTVELACHVMTILMLFMTKRIFRKLTNGGLDCNTITGKVTFVERDPIARRWTTDLSSSESPKRSSISVRPVLSLAGQRDDRMLVPQSYHRIFSWRYTLARKYFSVTVSDLLWHTLKHHTVFWILLWMTGGVFAWYGAMLDKTFSVLSLLSVPYPILTILNTNATILGEAVRQFNVWYVTLYIIVMTIACFDLFDYDERVCVAIANCVALLGMQFGSLHDIRSGIELRWYVVQVCALTVSVAMIGFAVVGGWFPGTSSHSYEHFEIEFNTINIVASCVVNIIVFHLNTIFNLLKSPNCFVSLTCRVRIVDIHQTIATINVEPRTKTHSIQSDVSIGSAM